MNQPAVETLRSFFLAMRGWGQEMIRHHRSLEWGNVDEAALERDRAEQRQRIEAIFESFCEVGSKARRLQDMGLAFDGDSPEYDPDYQPIETVRVAPGKVVIETRETNKLRWRFRYELVAVGEAWRIRDNKKRSSDKDPRWRADLL